MERAVPVLPADDLSAAKSVYVDKLGTTQDEYWGARTFSVHDPSDNTIFVIGPTRGARP